MVIAKGLLDSLAKIKKTIKRRILPTRAQNYKTAPTVAPKRRPLGSRRYAHLDKTLEMLSGDEAVAARTAALSSVEPVGKLVPRASFDVSEVVLRSRRFSWEGR